MRLIDADALKEYRCSICNNRERCEDRETVCSDIAEIDEQPTIEAELVKRGQWIYGENEDGQDGIFCSECDHFVPWYYDYYDKADDLINDNPRCPNCGARMDGGKNER